MSTKEYSIFIILADLYINVEEYSEIIGDVYLGIVFTNDEKTAIEHAEELLDKYCEKYDDMNISKMDTIYKVEPLNLLSAPTIINLK